jgi:hypothetical protein
VLSNLNNGEFATSDQIRDLVKSFNMALTTTLLDSVALDPGPDAAAVCQWCAEQVDETKWYDAEPEGPQEAEVTSESVEAVGQLLQRVISKTRFARRKRQEGAREVQLPGV